MVTRSVHPGPSDQNRTSIVFSCSSFVRVSKTKKSLKIILPLQDMDIYRRANVFERVLSFYASPTAGVSSKRKILHLIYRSTQVGGSTTLVTRAAIISWIQSQIVVLNTKDASTITALAHAVYDSSEKERVDTWSGGALSQAVENIEA